MNPASWHSIREQDSFYLTSKHLPRLVPRLGHQLQVLELSSREDGDDDAFAALVDRCPRLHTVQAQWTDASLLLAAQRLPRLVDYDIGWKVTSAGTASFLAESKGRVRSLSWLTEEDYLPHDFGTLCPRLEVFDGYPSNEVLESMASHCMLSPDIDDGQPRR